MNNPYATVQDTETSDWRTRAACIGADLDVFFPTSNDDVNGIVYTEARAICGGCPVRTECVDTALRAGDAFGMFGGLSPRQRRSMRERRGMLRNGRLSATPCGTEAGYQAHRRRKEAACAGCTEAQRIANRRRALRRSAAS